MAFDQSISVIIPALNEEKNLRGTVEVLYETVKERFNEFEIFIFNDGSIDKTGKIAEEVAFGYKNIKVFHHSRPKSIGYIYKKGISLARNNYLILINGKNSIEANEFRKILALVGKADMIIPYTINSWDRSLFRRSTSYVFTWLLNKIFRLNLHYYNHFVLHKREILNSIEIVTNSYAYQAEILIKLIKSGHSYIEVGVMDRFEKGIKTKAFQPRNICGVVIFLWKMVQDIYLKKFYFNKEF